jgi:hypothetical protein
MDNDSVSSNETGTLRNVTKGIGIKGMTCLNGECVNDSYCQNMWTEEEEEGLGRSCFNEFYNLYSAPNITAN